ncbi:hypothetical protein IIU_06970 [Bacillus cereus VD133]|uniref:Bro-N domain-containing protein n=1 Tax=Bacillus cereus VD133 TaxID=1053233 RepID=A0A9W5PJ88_BACCE|nr:phage repressor protein/antirepressor Ant [Bacillus cereus]EOO23563.1 hypothetical protein IIU_06970 [Bacillus cereus VD133]
MNQLQVFNHREFGALEVIQLNGREMFNLENAAWSLGYTKVAKGKTYLRKDRIDKVIQKADISVVVHDGQPYITEDGLYEFIFEAGTEKSKQYRKWVTSEVLPIIRKTGGYVATGREEDFIQQYFPSFSDDVKQMMVLDLHTKNQELTNQIEAQKHKVLFAESVQASTNSILVKELSVQLKQRGIDIGQNRLFKYFRENGYLCKKKGNMYNTPTQRSMEMGLFERQPYIRTNSKGEFETKYTPKVTGKGQLYFINKFLGKNQTA